MRAGNPRTLALANSPPVAPDAGWKPAHPGSGEQPAGCVGCGLEARAPWLWRAARRLRRMRAGSPRTLALASSPPVASDAGWKPAHPGSGEQPAGCVECGLEARAPWQFRQDAAGIDTRCIQIWHKNVSGASPPQQNDAEQPEQSTPFQQNRQRVEDGEDADQRKEASHPDDDP